MGVLRQWRSLLRTRQLESFQGTGTQNEQCAHVTSPSTCTCCCRALACCCITKGIAHPHVSWDLLLTGANGTCGTMAWIMFVNPYQRGDPAYAQRQALVRIRDEEAKKKAAGPGQIVKLHLRPSYVNVPWTSLVLPWQCHGHHTSRLQNGHQIPHFHHAVHGKIRHTRQEDDAVSQT